MLAGERCFARRAHDCGLVQCAGCDECVRWVGGGSYECKGGGGAANTCYSRGTIGGTRSDAGRSTAPQIEEVWVVGGSWRGGAEITTSRRGTSQLLHATAMGRRPKAIPPGFSEVPPRGTRIHTAPSAVNSPHTFSQVSYS